MTKAAFLSRILGADVLLVTDFTEVKLLGRVAEFGVLIPNVVARIARLKML